VFHSLNCLLGSSPDAWTHSTGVLPNDRQSIVQRICSNDVRRGHSSPSTSSRARGSWVRRYRTCPRAVCRRPSIFFCVSCPANLPGQGPVDPRTWPNGPRRCHGWMSHRDHRENSRSCSFSFRNSRARRSGAHGVYHSEIPGNETQTTKTQSHALPAFIPRRSARSP
jgi:hypothetical protein